ncbi:MAG: hypothetical protein FJ125_18185 [Deltaproteobacteria bacterium]|nr:hypothetical protein [Deltaproteobacteria bacterium]
MSRGFQRNPWQQPPLVLAAAALACLALLNARLDQEVERDLDFMPSPRISDHLLLPPVSVLKAVGLGQDSLVATVLWLKALAYFGDHFERDRKYRWLLTYIDTIKEVDDRFRKVFEWGGVVVMYGGRITNEAVRTSNRILEEGLERFPDDWQMSFMLGCNYSFELHSADPEIKKQHIETGLEYLRRASYNPQAPPYLVGLVSSLYRKVGWLEAAASYLEEAYLHADSPKLRAELEGLLKRYRKEAQVERLREEVEQFDRAQQESFPYLPPGLFRLVGPLADGRIPAWTGMLEKAISREEDEQLVESMLQERFVVEGLQSGRPGEAGVTTSSIPEGGAP